MAHLDVNETPNLGVALLYASRGLRVFPCSSLPDPKKAGRPTKRPLVSWGAESTTDEAQIRVWWSQYPTALVGLAMDERVWVLDCDRHEETEDGMAALDQLIIQNGPLPAVPYCDSLSGGRHYYFKQPADFKITNSRGSLPAGIDVRGVGGFVVAPGSICSAGTYSEGERSLAEYYPGGLVEAPAWLINFIKPSSQEAQKRHYEPSVSREENDRNEIEAALSFISSDDRATWLAIGAALHDSGEPWACEVWESWSSKSPKFDVFECGKTWNSYKRPYDGRRATLGTLFYLAGQNGYQPPDQFPDLPPWDGILRMPKRSSRGASAVIAENIIEERARGIHFLEDAEYQWPDPRSLPRRQWLYGSHFIRGFVSVTIAPGGVGKSSMSMVEALAMAMNRPLLGTPITARRPLNVAIWNGEDPKVELQRRMAGIALHYGVGADDVEGSICLMSGRERPIVLAETVRSDFVVAKPVVEVIKKELLDKRIDVLIVDPFVSSHRVNENDNGAIDAVSRLWAQVADECNCSIELVHHARKEGNGNAVTIDSARGASALISAARSVRTLNGMTTAQAEELGIDQFERRSFFNVASGKSSMAAGDYARSWRKIVSVMLGNGCNEFPSDNVGVVTQWSPPAADMGITSDQIAEIQKKVRDVEGKADVAYLIDPQAGNWVGKLIAESLGLDIRDDRARARVNRIVKDWIARGLIVKVLKKNPKGNERGVACVGQMIDELRPKK